MWANGKKPMVWNDLREVVGDIVIGGNVYEFYLTVCNKLSQPRHLCAEVPISTRHHMVGDHLYAGLVVLRDGGGQGDAETEFFKEVSYPYNIFACFSRGNKLSFCSGEAHHGSRPSRPHDGEVRQEHHEAISRALFALIGESGINMSRDT